MKPEEYYYLYFHKIKDHYSTYLYSSKSDIQVSVLTFNEENGLNFLDLLSKDDNYK